MPQVPYTGVPSVSPDNPMDVRSHATPQAFGAGIGNAVSGVGGEVEKLGDVLAKHALAYQERDNVANANELYVNAVEQAGALGAEYRNLKGKEAADYYTNTYVPALRKIMDDSSANAPNGDVRRRFQQDFRRRIGYDIENGAGYAATQNKQYQTNTAKARLKISENDAAAAPFDERVLDDSLNTSYQMVDEIGKAEGWSPDQIQLEKDKARSTIWSAKLIQMAEVDPIGAVKTLKENKDKIDGLTQITLEHKLQQTLVTKGSHYVANSAMTQTQSGREIFAMDYFMKQGWSKDEAAAIVGNLVAESRLDTNAVGDSGTSIGIAQHRLERREALEKFAKDKGSPVNDFQTQLEFIQSELGGTHKEAADAIKGKGAQEGAGLFGLLFERPQGAQTGVASNIAGYRDRVANATRLSRGDFSSEYSAGQLNGILAEGARQAEAIAPGNAVFADAVQTRIRSSYSVQKSAATDADRANSMTVQAALLGNGEKKPTSFEELFATPGIRDAYEALNPARQRAYAKQLEANAKEDVPLTQDRWTRYQAIRGMMSDPAQKAQAADMDLMSEDLPRTLKGQLLNEQRKLQQVGQNDTKLTQAMSQVKGLLVAAGIKLDPDNKSKVEEYNLFRGRFDESLRDFEQQHKRYPNPTEMRSLAAGLLRVTTPGGWFSSNKRAFEEGVGGAKTVTREEYAKLPSGTSWIAIDDPDRKVRVKP